MCTRGQGIGGMEVPVKYRGKAPYRVERLDQTKSPETEAYLLMDA